jgi:hypothetical protein
MSDFPSQLDRITDELLEVFGETVRYTPAVGESRELRAIVSTVALVGSDFPGAYLKVTALGKDFATVEQPARNDTVELRESTYRVIEVFALADGTVEFSLARIDH